VALDQQDLDQIREIVSQSQERLIALMQSNFDRIDQQFAQVTTRFDNQAARMELWERLRKLEKRNGGAGR